MKTIALSFILCIVFSGFTLEPEKKVFICKGKSSTKYHLDKNCKGLQYCSTEVYEITLTEAQKMKRSLCGWED